MGCVHVNHLIIFWPLLFLNIKIIHSNNVACGLMRDNECTSNSSNSILLRLHTSSQAPCAKWDHVLQTQLGFPILVLKSSPLRGLYLKMESFRVLKYKLTLKGNFLKKIWFSYVYEHKRGSSLFCSLFLQARQWTTHKSRKKGLRNQIYQHFDLGHPNLWAMKNKYLLLKPFRLWCLVMAAELRTHD